MHEAANLLKSGDRRAGRRLLEGWLARHAEDAAAWYGLAFCMDELEQRRFCLHQVVKFDPGYPNASRLLAGLETARPVERDRAGQSTRQMAARRRRSALKLALVGGLLLLVLGSISAYAWRQGYFWLAGGAAFLFLAGAFVGGVLAWRLYRRGQRAQRGAKAEIWLAGLLARLGDDYEVLHDIPCPQGNIDHLVIARSGVIFMIETKAHTGKVSLQDGVVLLDGRDPGHNFISRALQNSFWLREQITPALGRRPWVNPLLVFTNAYVPYFKPVKGVILLNRRYVLRVIRSMAQRGRSSNRQVWEKRAEIASLLHRLDSMNKYHFRHF